jgi:hypothetical protein
LLVHHRGRVAAAVKLSSARSCSASLNRPSTQVLGCTGGSAHEMCPATGSSGSPLSVEAPRASQHDLAGAAQLVGWFRVRPACSPGRVGTVAAGVGDGSPWSARASRCTIGLQPLIAPPRSHGPPPSIHHSRPQWWRRCGPHQPPAWHSSCTSDGSAIWQNLQVGGVAPPPLFLLGPPWALRSVSRLACCTGDASAESCWWPSAGCESKLQSQRRGAVRWP